MAKQQSATAPSVTLLRLHVGRSEVSEIFPEIRSEFCPEILSEISCSFPAGRIKKSQKTQQSTVQEINVVQSWISLPPLMAPKHSKTSILGAVIVSERGFL